MTAADSVLAGLGGVRSWQEDFYRDVHQHPELAHQEHATAGKVAERLQQFGYQVQRPARTSVTSLPLSARRTPTLDTGTQALVVAALAWLAR